MRSRSTQEWEQTCPSLALGPSSSLESRCDGRAPAAVLESEVKEHALRNRAMSRQDPEALMTCMAFTAAPACPHLAFFYGKEKNTHLPYLSTAVWGFAVTGSQP